VEGVNVLGGLVLPVPEVVRWRASKREMSFGGGGYLLIEVLGGKWLRVGGRLLPYSAQVEQYCLAIVAGARQRRLESLVRKVDDAVENAEVGVEGPGGSMGPSSLGVFEGPTGPSEEDC
jgi:hypothetical protein